MTGKAITERQQYWLDHLKMVTSQLPVDTWHDYLGEPTLADAILDRLVHNAYRMPLKGESMRKKPVHLTADKLGD